MLGNFGTFGNLIFKDFVILKGFVKYYLFS